MHDVTPTCHLALYEAKSVSFIRLKGAGTGDILSTAARECRGRGGVGVGMGGSTRTLTFFPSFSIFLSFSTLLE